MRFLTSVLVLALASPFSLVAAQNTTTPVPPPGQEIACGTCIMNNIQAFPDCAKLTINPSLGSTDPSKFSEAEKKCVCVLVNDPAWANKCKGADLCGEELITYTTINMGSVKAQYCSAGAAGASGKSNANALTGSNFKAAIATLAVGAVLAAF